MGPDNSVAFESGCHQDSQALINAAAETLDNPKVSSNSNHTDIVGQLSGEDLLTRITEREVIKINPLYLVIWLVRA